MNFETRDTAGKARTERAHFSQRSNGKANGSRRRKPEKVDPEARRESGVWMLVCCRFWLESSVIHSRIWLPFAEAESPRHDGQTRAGEPALEL